MVDMRMMLALVFYTSTALAIDAPKLTVPTTSTYTAPTISSSVLTLKPEITGYGHSGCIDKGSSLTILGKNFGSQKGVSLGGHGINVNLPVISWASSRIVVTLPNDTRINNNEWYYTGIKDLKTGSWLSNINKNITICAAKTGIIGTAPSLSLSTKLPVATTPSLKLPSTGEATPAPSTATVPAADPPADERAYDDYYGNDSGGNSQWQDYGGYGPEPATPTVLPNSYGSLIDRQLPPPPPNLAVKKKQQAFIKKHTEPNELVVISADMDAAKQLAQQLGSYGLSAKRRRLLKNLGLVISTFRVPTGSDMQQITQDVRQAYPDMWVDMNHRYSLQAGNRNTAAAKKLVQWPAGNSNCGKGLRIGLVDTGINKAHPALRNRAIVEHSVLSPGIKPAQADHGTAIASLLVGNSSNAHLTGLLPAAKLFSVAVFRQRDKYNTDTTAEWIIAAIDWLLSQKVQAINMSIGGPRNLLVDLAIQRSIQSGIAVVAAAGNNGPESAPVYPAAQPGVIAVTAVDSQLQLYSKASHGNYIDFAAPGVDLWSADGNKGGRFVSGTSYSTPFVTAGMISLAQTIGPRKAYEDLRQRARDLGSPGKDDTYGWGLLQVAQVCR